MVIKHLSSEVNLELGQSQHSMVVGLLDGGAVELPIDALTYGQLVGAFEQLHIQAQEEAYGTQSPYVEPVPTVEDVRQQVEGHLGHQLAAGPIPQDELDAAEQLRQLEEQHTGQGDSAQALLESVGFYPDPEPPRDLDAFAAGGAEGDDSDPGEQNYDLDDDDGGVEAY